MKTIKLLLAVTAGFLSFKNLNAAGSIKTSTLNPCTPQVTITAIPNTYGCFSITAASVTPNDLDAYYHWNFQDGTTATGKTVYHCCSPVSSPANYTFTVVYGNPLMICPAPVIPPIYSLTLVPPAASLCVYNTSSVTLAANSATVWAGVTIPEIFTNYNYGDGSPTAQTNTHTYATCGNYVIKIKEWNMNTPNDTCYAYVPVNIACAGATGIKNPTNETITAFYPSPVTDVVIVKTLFNIKEISVSDILGKKIALAADVKDQQSVLHTKDLIPGAYFVKIKFENGQETCKKFVKQ